jgi:hypothetical protein
MNRSQSIIIFSIISAVGFSGIFLSSCKERPRDGTIVFTQVAEKLTDINIVPGESASQNIRARIVYLDPDKAGIQPFNLTEEYFSARSPEISYDGTRMIFTARKKQEEKWQIWEINFKNLKSRQITSLPDNCTDPAYLPNGRVVFSRETRNSNLNTGNALFSCNPDGSDIRQVTFNPHSYAASTVFQDGRILTLSSKPGFDNREESLMVLRPDGTKNELFYKGMGGGRFLSRAWETPDGRIVFIESDNDNPARGKLISINYNQPFHSFTDLATGSEGDFKSVFPVRSGKFLVSYRKSQSERYNIYEFDPVTKSLGQAIFSSHDFDITEVAEVQNRQRPKKLPSEVDMGVKTGLILCQDINFQIIKSFGSASGLPEFHKIRIIGLDSILGEVDAEKDGSFYLKVIADTPFRIQRIDDKGCTIGETCDWIYLRPNERRGCVGCHEDQEIVPENKVSMAVRHAPVNIPVHMGKVAEKKVSLE